MRKPGALLNWPVSHAIFGTALLQEPLGVANRRQFRIFPQWRGCFVWTPEGPKNIENVDYH